MRIMALTGGIATGKSTVGEFLRRELPVGFRLFDCDASVKGLLERDETVAREIAERFGSDAIDPEGRIDRGFLRTRVFSDAGSRRRLEEILHPRVRTECLAYRDRAAKDGAALFVADVPLLFEKGFDFGQEMVLLAATSRDTQIQRLKARSRFDDECIEAILAAQLPIRDKLLRADVVFWNEGPLEILQHQIRRFARSFFAMLPNDSEPSVAPVPAAPEVAESSQVAVPALPASIDINVFRAKPLADLQAMADAVPVRIQAGLSKSQLVFELLGFYGREGVELIGEGVLEQGKDNFAMLRDPARSFRPAPDDLHVHGNLVRECGLKPGQRLRVKVRAPRERDKYLSVVEVLAVEGIPLADYKLPKDFEKLTPLFPDRRVMLEGEGPEFLSCRVLDLVAPLGKGQRGLIVAPPRGGKTILLKQIAKAVRRNHPEAELVILLLDERPEEVTDFEETAGAEVFASTFDEAPKRHAQVADLVLERAKRLVELGRDVILLLDSLTRLARGHNSSMQGGPIGSGGINPVALQKSRKFFGTARNVEEGGSLTILATALVETESRMDDVIFEEFKGTGNMEVKLDRELAERRVFPAIHIPQSGTRNDDRLYHPDEFVRVLEIRRQLAQLPVGDAIETLMSNLKSVKSNAELLLRGLR
jgi:transcription termination factor Rho